MGLELLGGGLERGVRPSVRPFFCFANEWLRTNANERVHPFGRRRLEEPESRRTRRVRRSRGGFARTCWASRDPRFTSASVMVRNSSSVSASVRLSARAAGANVLARRVGTTANAVRRAAGACAAARLSARAPRAHHAVPLRSVVAVAFIL